MARVSILLRADSGFARDELMAWCEAHGVDYIFGLARNERLVDAIADELAVAEAESLATGGSAGRRFADFAWRTLDSWSRTRRVVAKAEHLPKERNPRFIVTSLAAHAIDARTLYEDVYCARGEVENRIKEQQLDLFAGRTSAATMRANQLRLWFAASAETSRGWRPSAVRVASTNGTSPAWSLPWVVRRRATMIWWPASTASWPL